MPEEWVEPLQKVGYTTIAEFKEVEKPSKLTKVEKTDAGLLVSLK